MNFLLNIMKTFRNQKKICIDGTVTKDIEKIQAIKIPDKYNFTRFNNSFIFPKPIFLKKIVNDSIDFYDIDFISKSSKKLIEYNNNNKINDEITIRDLNYTLSSFIVGIVIGFGINTFVFYKKVYF